MKIRLGAVALEVRNVAGVLEKGRTGSRVGPLAVSGMLAEQLAKELSAGAAQGAVVVADDPRAVHAEVAIRVVAGDPSPEDDAFVRVAERAEIPVVIVQLWPQADWREPFVLSPFVVECKTGEGFPIATIAQTRRNRGRRPDLARRARAGPEGHGREEHEAECARPRGVSRRERGAKRLPPARSSRSSRSASSSRMRALEEPQPGKDARLPPAVAAAAAIAASYGFREIARLGRRRLPGKLSDTVVAVAGTWLLAEVFRRLEARGIV